MKSIVTDSLRYWEPRRIAFNVVRGLVVVGSAFHHQPSFSDLGWQPVIGLLFAAVFVNVRYCAAYAADILVQLSDCQAVWRRYCWLLWVSGTVLATGIVLFHE